MAKGLAEEEKRRLMKDIQNKLHNNEEVKEGWLTKKRRMKL
jgi:hypothetical protein